MCFLSSKYLAVDLGLESSKGLVSISEVSSHGCCHGFGSSLEGLSTDVRAIIQMSPRDSFSRCHQVSSVSNTKTKETDGGKETEHRIQQKSNHLSAALMLEAEDQRTSCPLSFAQNNSEISQGAMDRKACRCERWESRVARGQLRGWLLKPYLLLHS